MGAFVYGVGREWTLGKLDPLIQKIPIPGVQYTDELAMFGVSWLLAKGKIPVVNKAKISRSVGRAGMMIEAYRIGAMLAATNFQLSGGTTKAGTAPQFAVTMT